jgi:hypothetical protein
MVLPGVACALCLSVFVSGCWGGDETSAATERAELKRAIKEELHLELKREIKDELLSEIKRLRSPLAPSPVDPRRPVRGGRAVTRTPDPEPLRRPIAPRPEVGDPSEPNEETDEMPIEPATPEVDDPADPEQPETSDSLIEITRLAVSTGVENRVPTGVSSAFRAAEAPKLYAFVVAKNPGEDSKVTIEWVFRGDKVSSLELKVGHSTRGWRTWATTRITPKLVGNWTVRILDPAGKLLKSTAFSVR